MNFCVVGFGIYKGGVHLNLAKFFSFTAFVLVLVAAGLVATAIHTSHEAGWFNGLQDQAWVGWVRTLSRP